MQTRYKNIVLLHGLGGSPESSVKMLETALRQSLPHGTEYQRLLCPHSDRSLSWAKMKDEFENRYLSTDVIPENSLVIGVSMGGFRALKAQEIRSDLDVIAISAPSNVDEEYLNVVATSKLRMALYSTEDAIIQGRTLYPAGVEAYNLPWLSHNTATHIHPLAFLIQQRLLGKDFWESVEKVFQCS